mgnify:CR=1 FL=1
MRLSLPLYVAGHWVPEQSHSPEASIRWAAKANHSFKIEWQSRSRCKARRDLADASAVFDVRRAVKESTPLRNPTAGMICRGENR